MFKKKIAVLALLSGLIAPFQSVSADTHKTCVKAPRFVQKFFNKCIKAQHQPYSVGDFTKRLFLKTFGFSTVYIGAPKRMPEVFQLQPWIGAFVSPTVVVRGTYCNPRYFTFKDNKLSDILKQTLAHESVHVTRGPLPTPDESIDWFVEEYMADKGCIDILIKLQEYGAIKAAAKRIFLDRELPYKLGTLDGIHNLIKNNPNDEQVKDLINWLLLKTKSDKKRATFILEDEPNETDKKLLPELLFVFNEILTLLQDPQKNPVTFLQQRLDAYINSDRYKKFIQTQQASSQQQSV